MFRLFSLSFLFRMATVSKDGTWKIWDIDGELLVCEGPSASQT